MQKEEPDPLRVYTWAVDKVQALLTRLWYQAQAEIAGMSSEEFNKWYKGE